MPKAKNPNEHKKRSTKVHLCIWHDDQVYSTSRIPLTFVIASILWLSIGVHLTLSMIGASRFVPANKITDPNTPKRALSAYMYFAMANRELVKAEEPNASFGEIGRKLGAKWKSMTQEQKLPYEKQANQDKQRYQSEKLGHEAALRTSGINENPYHH